MGLKVNQGKAKYVIDTGNKRQVTVESHIKIMDHKSECVHVFECLGILHSVNNYVNE
jgi:hypothetical protein